MNSQMFASRLTVATVRRTNEAIRILKRLRIEQDQAVRKAQIVAVKQLLAAIEQGEEDQLRVRH